MRDRQQQRIASLAVGEMGAGARVLISAQAAMLNHSSCHVALHIDIQFVSRHAGQLAQMPACICAPQAAACSPL